MFHVFKDHIGRTIEAYVDDIVVKFRKADDLVADLRIVFDCLRVKGVKFNVRNACSESLEACSWVSLSPSGALSPTLKKSRPSLGWD